MTDVTLALDFQNQTTAVIDIDSLRQHLTIILRRLGWVDTVVIEVTIVSKSTIQQLNQQFLGHDQPTDVLSFPNESQQPHQPLGEIIIAAPIAETQAREAGLSFQAEVELLAGHSLLHLVGFHHA